MNVHRVDNLTAPVGELLEEVGAEGILLEGKNQTRYAVIPLDDDLLDYLVERSPHFREDCRRIRQQMRTGKFLSHAEVRKQLEDDKV